jgi:uncharacterized protein (DUF488 family)
MVTVHTIGHGTLTAADLAGVLTGAGIAHLVDVRSFPGSRRNPQHARARLAEWLPEAGVAYSWEGRLGGRRRPVPDSPNVALRHEAFRAYADHMATDEFATALDSLVEMARHEPLAVMCAETLWWRCHRRLLADALVLLDGVRVRHLFPDGSATDHAPMPEARVERGHLVYDRGTTPALL